MFVSSPMAEKLFEQASGKIEIHEQSKSAGFFSGHIGYGWGPGF